MIYIQHTVPSPATEIIGREREADELRKLLLSTDVRLVTLTGPGGMGKTRLAIHVASLMTESFNDGVYFVPLAQVGDPALFFLTLAQSLGIQPDTTQSLRETVLRYFRQREVLLVLDNFEQIVGAAADVALLLSSCPRLTILVTSRIVLHVRGEHEYPVLPLALPAVNASMEVEALSHYASVLLFVQRATAVRPDFRLSLSNAAAIAEICLRLDGLPLAIELAAARTKLLTPQAMLPRLQHRLQLLRGGAVDLPERQQTLYNTIRWSYDLLDEQEQQVFNRLAVFQGYWNLDAATAVLQMSDIDLDDIILSLVNKSMVQQREMPNGDIFFTLLETLREFALEQLQQSNDATTVHERHIDYYTGLAASCTRSTPDEEHRQWVETVTIVFDNMRTAFYWSFHNGRIDKAARLFAALENFWLIRYTTEGNVWLEQLRPFIDSLSADVRYLVYHGSGFFRCERGEIQAAIGDFQQALTLLPTGEQDVRYTILAHLALNYHLIGETSKAEALYLDLIAQVRSTANLGALAGILPGYSTLLYNTGRIQTAIAMLEETVELMRIRNIRRSLPGVLVILSPLYSGDNMEKVRTLAEESLLLCQEFGDRRNEIKACNTLAGVAIDRHEYDKAGQYLYYALQQINETGSYRLSFFILLNLVSVFLATSAVEAAARLFGYTDSLLESFEEHAMVAMLAEFRESLREQLVEKITPDQFELLQFEGKESTSTAIHTLIHTTLVQYVFSVEIEVKKTAPSVEFSADLSTDYDLTNREIEILGLLAKGLSNKEIGEKLFISMRTVHAHVRSIYSKINVSSRSAATRFAIERGW